MEELLSLDLSSNRLTGSIPDCWSKRSLLYVLDFSNNYISGEIPDSICSPPSLFSLHVRNNSLTGLFPSSLKNCSGLQVLDLGWNKFSGAIPDWLGVRLSRLKILRLEYNVFVGHIPEELSQLAHLHILDLSYNDFSGPIPPIFGNFTAMKESNNVDPIGTVENYIQDVSVIMKGSDLEYNEEGWLSLLRIIDLSGNQFSGNIPEQITSLHALQSLNLSRNLLTGSIAESISGLTQLQSLDLSRNLLSGTIPMSLLTLTFLEALDLSYNNLSGRIPLGNQLQTFIDPSIYAGNINLCGFPLNKTCPSDNPVSNNGESKDNDRIWLFIGTGCGYLLGLWLVYGTMLLKRRWRLAYFRVFDNLCDRLYVFIAVNWSRLQEKLRRTNQDD